MQDLYLFFIASLLLNLTPGNDMIYVASRSVSQGTKAGVFSALGVFIGCFVHILAAVLGLSLIIMKSALLFQTIKYIGAGYLVYLGIRALTATSGVAQNMIVLPTADTWKLLKQGIITNALNPKVALFFISFLPQFIQSNATHYRAQLFILGLWFAAQGTLVLIFVAWLIGRAGNFLKKNSQFWRVQEKITGVILIGLGIKVALLSKK